MKKSKLLSFVFSMIIVGVAPFIYASSVPSLSLNTTTGSANVQATVIGGDPNSQALLYYLANSTVKSINIGTTNSSGNLNSAIDSITNGIVAGAPVHIEVNGQPSPQVSWPNYLNSGNLPMSQNSVTLSVGQNTMINPLVSADIAIVSNTNSTVANATVSNNNLNISAINLGTDQITVCATNIGCNNISVNVVGSGSSLSASIYLSQNSVSLTPGQSQTVSISGSGTYSISLNSNPGVASVNISGNNLNINAISTGSTDIKVCAMSGSGVTCTGLSVIVNQQNIITTTFVQSTIAFSQNNVTLSKGQSQDVTIYGSSPFQITNNSSPDVISANIGGGNNLNVVNLYGVSTGGSNITICQFGTTICGNIYAYVPLQGSGESAQTTVPPAVSSFSVTSGSNSSGFLNAGNTLTIGFNANQPVSTPNVTVNGQRLQAVGSGSGPYTVSYTLTGNETQPLPVIINFNNSAGSGGQILFNMSVPTINNSSASASVASATVSSVGSKTPFTQYLHVGISGVQVTTLQKRLTSDNLYSGPINGNFGPLTEAAVKKFQKKHGISQTGYIGPATRNVLNNS